MKVVILTEGSRDIGFGHVTRCKALCEAFKEKNIEPLFLVNGDRNIRGLLKGERYKIFDWLRDKDGLRSFLNNSGIVIIDSYLANSGHYKMLSKCVPLVVCIDDMNRLSYPRGIVVNGGVNAERLKYIRKKESLYLLGPKYSIMRKEFWAVPIKKIRKNVKSVILTFGGSNGHDITQKVLKLLLAEYPGVMKEVVVGKGFSAQSIMEIELLVDTRTRLVYYPDAGTIKNMMLNADIAISSGGQTVNELARLGVPTIAIAVADNQVNNVKGWRAAGFIDYAGWWQDKNTINKVNSLFNRCLSGDVRKDRSRIGRSLVDGMGPRRIVEKILHHNASARELCRTIN